MSHNEIQHKPSDPSRPEVYIEWEGKKTKLSPGAWMILRESLPLKAKFLIFALILSIIFSCVGFLLSLSLIYVELTR